MQNRPKIVVLTTIAGLVWISAVAAGLRFMINYERTPGAIGVLANNWPSDTAVIRDTAQPTLLVFAHPRCPCTRATIGELAELMAHAQGKLHARVIFFEPPNSGAEWKESDLHRSAAAIPGVTVLSDVAGLEAKRFGAETSGHALLFSPDGRLLFNGGITASRGHAGENAGESAILAIVNGERAALNRSFVFGCSFSARDALAQISRK